MKRIIYGTLFLALVGTFVVGCQKENLSSSIIHSNIKSNQERRLDYGNLHNAYMTNLALNFKSDNSLIQFSR